MVKELGKNLWLTGGNYASTFQATLKVGPWKSAGQLAANEGEQLFNKNTGQCEHDEWMYTD